VSLTRKIISSMIAISMLSLSLLPTLTIDTKTVLAQGNSFTAVRAAYSHSLALRSDGTVWAWGNNQYGQLGEGSKISSAYPVQVQGLSQVIGISTAHNHAVALKSDGTVWTWGMHQYGSHDQIDTTPIRVKELENIRAVSAGYGYTLALKDDGTVWGWGYNFNGNLGNGKKTNSYVPVQADGLTDVVHISANANRSYAVRADGTVLGWGNNSRKEIVDSDVSVLDRPIQIPGLTEITSIADGNDTLALRRDGTVFLWGEFVNFGGNSIRIPYPTQISGLSEVRQIGVSAVTNQFFIIKNDLSLWSWSSFTKEGENVRWGNPNQVTSMGSVLDAATGYGNFLAIAENGEVWAWGNNYEGTLGDGTKIERKDPIKTLVNTAPNAPQFIQLAYSNQEKAYFESPNLLILEFSHRIEKTSVNPENIKLIDENGNPVSITIHLKDPTKVQVTPNIKLLPGESYTLKLSNLVDAYGLMMKEPAEKTFTVSLSPYVRKSNLSAGMQHSLSLIYSTVLGWGDNSHGQLGMTGSSTLPKKIVGLENVSYISAGGYHNLAIKAGEVWSWGLNDEGQLGYNSLKDSRAPQRVPELSGFVEVAAGDKHSLGLKEDGTVWAWGLNDLGQLGEGTTINQLKPVQVKDLEHIIGIAAGGRHSLAIKVDGTVWAWGDNQFGQLGNEGVFDFSPIPVKVAELNEITQVSAGYEHSLALKADGTVYAWGYNKVGQLGDGTQKAKITPVKVQGLYSITKIEAGYDFSLAMVDQGPVYGWGGNYLSQLGIPDTTKSIQLTPLKLSLTNVTDISAGGAHGLTNEFSWGFNFQGQLGNGTFYHSSVPVNRERRSFVRLGGENRIQTANLISQAGWNYGSDAVVLTRGDNFPDALTGTPLAYMLEAPILLTDSKQLDAETEREIERLAPKEIYILGLSGAISKEIEQKLSQKYKVIRIGGVDRYETSAKIAQFLTDKGFATGGRAVIAYGQNFPDALAVSSAAAYQKMPILLTETYELPVATQNFLQTSKINQTIVVGGEGVISSSVQNRLPNPTRYAGEDRYLTATKIANELYQGTNSVYIATGFNFPDALAGSVLAARTNSPILLVNQNSPTGTSRYLDYYKNNLSQLTILGGSGVISDNLVGELAYQMGWI
jgi:alpha-tubulin suppressor-like RCC1 family protein/putative cell wall-binding protein